MLCGSLLAAIPSALPEFRSEKQLTRWRAEKLSSFDSQSGGEISPFYTGRPYLPSTNAYVFKYRSYNAGILRWTSEDPSGYPDGANNIRYAPVPTSQFDFCGLEVHASDIRVVAAVISGWQSVGFDMAANLGQHSMNGGADRTATSGEIDAIKASSAFTNQFNKGWLDTHYGLQGSGSYSYEHLVNFGVISDLGLAYGHVTFGFDISVQTNESGYEYNVDYSFDDIYDFDPNSNINAIVAFHNLQAAGIASVFTTSGQFSIFYE